MSGRTDAKVYDLSRRRAERGKTERHDRAPDEGAVWPCVDCGVLDEDAVMVGYLPFVSDPDSAQVACPIHVHQHIPRRQDVEELARTRAEVTGETKKQARAALERGGAPEGQR